MLYKFNSEFIIPSYAIFRIPCKWNQIAMWLQGTQSFQYETCNYILKRNFAISILSIIFSFTFKNKKEYLLLILNYFITLCKSNIQNIKLRNLKHNIFIKKIE